MLPDSHSLLDEVVEVLGQVRGQTLGLEDPQDLVAGDKTYLGHTMGVPQNHTWNTATNRLALKHELTELFLKRSPGLNFDL